MTAPTAAPSALTEASSGEGKEAGKEGPANPHSLRHFFAREFLLSGGDLATLADLLGHSSAEVTKSSYAIFTEREMKEKHRRHSPVVQLFVESDGV